MNTGTSRPTKAPLSPWAEIIDEIWKDIDRLRLDPDFEFKFKQSVKAELVAAYNRGCMTGRRAGYDEGKQAAIGS